MIKGVRRISFGVAAVHCEDLWCTRCKCWHGKSAFGKDSSRPGRGNLAASCKDSRRDHYERTYVKKGKPIHSGPFPFPARSGDKMQARQRINVLVRTGRLAHPNTLPCVDCGHVHTSGERRHEYDHHLGYAAEHHYDVQAVCTRCHSARAMQRGEIQVAKLRLAAKARKEQRKTHCEEGHAMAYGADGMWRCQECRRAYYREYNKNRERANG